MILRSQLRMNKNIVFPFISCIMIMLTLLVLIRKSADELSAAKKELGLCKQQQDSLYTQLQSAIEYKLRLEKSLQNEKLDGKQKIKEMQNLLDQEKESRKKDKEQDDERFEAAKQSLKLKENENKDVAEDNEKIRKQLVDKEEENSKLNAKLIAMRSENEQLLAAKDKIIDDLKAKLKTSGSDAVLPAKKTTAETNENMHVLQQGDQIQMSGSNNATPVINPQAILEGLDPSPKGLAPPPPPLQQPNNEDHENSMQKMRDDLNVRPSGDQKPEENVINAPDNKEKQNLDSANAYDKKDEPVADAENAKNSANMFIPMPNIGQANKNPQASSASNNVAEPAHPADDPQQVLPMPNQNANAKVKEIPKQMRDYVGGDYGKDMIGEDEGEEGEYMDNEIAPAQKKVNQYPKEKRQEESVNDGESVIVHPK